MSSSSRADFFVLSFSRSTKSSNSTDPCLSGSLSQKSPGSDCSNNVHLLSRSLRVTVKRSILTTVTVNCRPDTRFPAAVCRGGA